MVSVFIALAVAGQQPPSGLAMLKFVENGEISASRADVPVELLAVQLKAEPEVRRVTGYDVQTGQPSEIEVLLQRVQVLGEESSREILVVSPDRYDLNRLEAGKRYLISGYSSQRVGEVVAGTGLKVNLQRPFFVPRWTVQSDAGEFVEAESSASSEIRTLFQLLTSFSGPLQQKMFGALPPPPAWRPAASQEDQFRKPDGDSKWLVHFAQGLAASKQLPIFSYLVKWHYEEVQPSFVKALIEADAAGPVPDIFLVGLDLWYVRGLLRPGKYRVDSSEMVRLANTARDTGVKRLLLDQAMTLKEGDVVPCILLMDVDDLDVKSRAAHLLALRHQDESRNPGRIPPSLLAEKLAEWRLYWRDQYGLPGS